MACFYACLTPVLDRTHLRLILVTDQACESCLFVNNTAPLGAAICECFHLHPSPFLSVLHTATLTATQILSLSAQDPNIGTLHYSSKHTLWSSLALRAIEPSAVKGASISLIRSCFFNNSGKCACEQSGLRDLCKALNSRVFAQLGSTTSRLKRPNRIPEPEGHETCARAICTARLHSRQAA